MDGQPGIAGEGQPNVYCSVNTNRGYYRRPVISFSAVVLDVVKYKGSEMDQLQGGRGRQPSIDTPPKGFTQGQANGRAHHLPTGASSWSAIELLKAQVITAHLEQGGGGSPPGICPLLQPRRCDNGRGFPRWKPGLTSDEWVTIGLNEKEARNIKLHLTNVVEDVRQAVAI